MEHQRELVEAIHQYCRASQKVYPFTSYGLKHIFEGLLGFYISNDEFKVAMMLAGFHPAKLKETNHRYKIKLLDVDELVKLGIYGRI
ncbi:MAG: hypothetical protein K5764_01600 [Prevotella sp.]|nr:hypothetical protein [Prevotella sp.]